jgi:hypothetical protein
MDPEQLRALVEEYRQNQMMAGQQDLIPEYDGGDPRTYVQLLAASHGSQLASQFTGGADIAPIMQEAADAGYYEGDPMGGLLGDALQVVGATGEFLAENPALFFALPFAVAGITGAFGASGSAAAAADGLAPMTTGGATMLPGGTGAGVAAVNSALAGAPMATLPAAIATPAAISAFTGTGAAAAAAPAAQAVLDSTGTAIPGTEPITAAGPAVGGAGVTPPAVTPPAVTPPAPAPTFFSRVGGFLQANRDIIGSVLAGVGESMLTSSAQENLLERQHELISANYAGTNPGRAFRGAAQNTQSTRPSERFGRSQAGGYGLRYNSQNGRMERELMPSRTPT